MVFDGDLLGKSLAIVGEGSVVLRIASDKPQALVAVRLNDVHPDGSVERVAYGLLNLTHRESHAKPSRLKRGAFYDVEVKLTGIAQNIPAGHRLRISISTSYWPMVWPSPEPVTLTIDPAGSFVNLPVLRSEKGFKRVQFAAVEYATPLELTVTGSGSESREIIHTIDDQTSRFVVTRDDGRCVIDDIGTEVAYTKQKIFTVGRDDPLASAADVTCSAHFRRGTWDARVETETHLTADKKNFYLSGTVTAIDRGKPFMQRKFNHSFKRDYL